MITRSQDFPHSPRLSKRPLARVSIRLLGFLICAAAPCSTAYGSIFGTVLGTVKDPSGGVVPKAIVSLTNVGTASVRSTVSNPNGSYEFVNVDVVVYKVSIEAVGFHTSNSNRSN